MEVRAGSPLRTGQTDSGSVNSIDDVLANDDADLDTDAWADELRERIEQILDRKRSSTAGREESLGAYCRLLTRRFSQDDLRGRTADVVLALLKSVKATSSERETAYALKGESPIHRPGASC